MAPVEITCVYPSILIVLVLVGMVSKVFWDRRKHIKWRKTHDEKLAKVWAGFHLLHDTVTASRKATKAGCKFIDRCLENEEV